MVATTGAGMTPVQHEFFRTKASQPGFLVQYPGIVDQVRPARRRHDIDLNNTRIRCNHEFFHARIRGRRVSLYTNRDLQCGCRVLNHSQQAQVVFQQRQRWQEHKQFAFARFNT